VLHIEAVTAARLADAFAVPGQDCLSHVTRFRASDLDAEPVGFADGHVFEDRHDLLGLAVVADEQSQQRNCQRRTTRRKPSRANDIKVS
ncbi:hypothetical protein U2063_15390, partial [Listeria monocytogenes]|uniref:hypothetical protein n=1 Tax=Listeria monocytogenes TaxID=1639 RepID=UPI002FDC48BE